MTMLEKVARAIHARMKAHEKEYVGEFNDMWGTHTHVGDGYFDLNEVARAAIEAMREPTREMVFAAWNEMDGGTNKNGPLVRESSTCHVDNDGPLQSDTAFEVWQAMIDAALKETP